MECQQVSELLPWYRNRTLDEAEAAAVRDHLESCATCREDLKSTEFTAEVFRAHPSASDLIAHSHGDIEEQERREQLKAHLQWCRSCAEELDLIRESRKLELEADRFVTKVGTSRCKTGLLCLLKS